MTPAVSVIIATYRRDLSLEHALNSLAEQIFADFEVIVVDDNGDGEWNKKVDQIIECVRSKYSNLHLSYIVNESNKGSAKTRNVGIESAQGEYITFLDDDDIYLPEKIERQYCFMKKNGSDFSITDLDLYNEQGKLIERRDRTYIKQFDKESLEEYHLKHHMTGTDTMMFRKDYLIKIGMFSPIDVGDEFYLMQKAINGGGSFGYLPGCDVKAYVHTGEGGLSSGEGKIRGENNLYDFKKQYFYKLKPRDRKYIKVRHYAVIAYAELRRKNLIGFTWNALAAFFVSPALFMSLLKK